MQMKSKDVFWEFQGLDSKNIHSFCTSCLHIKQKAM